ncbi:kinase-like protein [Guyanagaster necrorhizus]|uniref:non-specific serine/threonine protein kinase n=1 Tax=Guyanagaster necrorhizus TaxID=856835 RepID=A0A9P7VEU2_9AGAR|nr:kinase-like protein [Guyanagaster necrorhizus MCA 3950]KAG7439095.1 kinase-like protein [Guyanagaster necrorhizus MCA 3950]
MAPQPSPAKYSYVVTSVGPRILPVEEPPCKDEESPAGYNAGGYLPVELNDTFKNNRYKVVRKLGWGHFSTVWLVKDAHLQRHSALKVVKSAGRYAETARDEIKLLSRVTSFSPTHPGRQHIVSFLDSFSHQGPEACHICIVFEPLGENLLALIERNKKHGVSRALVKVITRQTLLGLQYLHDECDLVHTDIKPENILISIPDIETHISTELSQSPSPTSRRVGVPLPSNVRSALVIRNQRSTRRSVQIFDSQPLSSPSRSAGIHGLRMSFGALNGCQGGSGSGLNSTPSPLALAQRSADLRNGAGLTKSAPKVPSGLSITASPNNSPDDPDGSKSAAGSSQKPNPPPNPPSTSSSSSSIASTSASGSTDAVSCSIISTPPTSLSHSIGAVALGLLGQKHCVKVDVSPAENNDGECQDIVNGVPIAACEHKDATNAAVSPLLSWKDKLGMYGSWKEKASFSLSSSYKSSMSSTVFSHTASGLGHSRSNSGLSVSGSWKDPGLSSPAPAVVVSTSVMADGKEERGEYFHLSSPNSASRGALSTKSCSSSNTATVARPSPTGTIHADESKLSLVSSDSGASSTHLPYPAVVSHDSDSSNLLWPVGNKSSGRSLLSQTAPRRSKVASSSIPPQSIDFHHAPSIKKSSPPPISISFTDITPLASPAVPPPTPSSPTSLSTQIPSPPPRIETSQAPQPMDIPSVHPAEASPLMLPLSIKIADLGNATPSKKHFTEDIQTRQYRAPEAILGRKDWDGTADIWSVACVVFELLTAEYLFDPQGQSELFTKDDDHMAQIIELLGDFSMEVKMSGKYSRQLFDHTGVLRYIRSLKPWPLKRVMVEKYLYTDRDATILCDFLEPMLVVDMKQRSHARDMIDHQWLDVVEGDEVVGSW